MKEENPNQFSLEDLINRWDSLDQLDRNIVKNGIGLQNIFSHQGQEILKLAIEKGGL